MRVAIFLVCVATAIGVHNYDHLSLLKISPKANHHDEILSMIGDEKIDVWKKYADGSMDVVVDEPTRDLLQSLIFIDEVKIEGPQFTKIILDQMIPHDGENLTWSQYHTLSQINNYLDEIAAEHPEYATVSTLTTSWEGREIKMLTLSTDPRPDSPIILVDAGIHAREWIAPATCTYIIDELSHDPTMLDQVTFVFIPVLNVDGYEYSWQEDRLWRKTRSQRASEACVGTDGNRNFDFHWNEIGTSDISCSDIYAGSEAASENLTKGVSQFMADNAGRIKAYITLHSYGQLMLLPYGYTMDPPANYDEMMRVAKATTDAITAVYGTPYEYGSASVVLYSNSGTSRDYAAGVYDIPLVYTIELRDEGNYGFVLPADQILPTAIETYEGFKVIISEVINLGT